METKVRTVKNGAISDEKRAAVSADGNAFTNHPITSVMHITSCQQMKDHKQVHKQVTTIAPISIVAIICL
jgi:hypothetical protein